MNSIDHYIKFSLSIKDKNVVFFDYDYQVIKSRRAKVYRANVKVNCERCPQCGFDHLSHNGHYKSRVLYPAANASEPVYLELQKTLICKDCGASVMVDGAATKVSYFKTTGRRSLCNFKMIGPNAVLPATTAFHQVLCVVTWIITMTCFGVIIAIYLSI